MPTQTQTQVNLLLKQAYKMGSLDQLIHNDFMRIKDNGIC